MKEGNMRFLLLLILTGCATPNPVCSLCTEIRSSNLLTLEQKKQCTQCLCCKESTDLCCCLHVDQCTCNPTHKLEGFEDAKGH